MGAIEDSQKVLAECRRISAGILVAYSDGKDSRIVLDLCSRVFDKVAGFYMALVPGLECVDVRLEQARRRYGIVIREYIHPIVGVNIREGVYCDPSYRRDDLKPLGLGEIYALAMVDAGIGHIATGNKRVDSSWRRNFMKLFNPDNVIHPIFGWRTYDVAGYLQKHGLGMPMSNGGTQTGIDLSPQSLCWMYDNFPADFRRVCEVFPFAEAVIYRRKFYGQ